jgi:hypothetical protein
MSPSEAIVHDLQRHIGKKQCPSFDSREARADWTSLASGTQLARLPGDAAVPASLADESNRP